MARCLALMLLVAVMEAGVVCQRCQQFETSTYGGRHGERTLAKLTASVARHPEVGGHTLAGAERPRYLEESLACGLLRCRGGSPAGRQRGGKAGAQDHAQADSGSDGVSETTAEWRKAEQRSAANARRLQDRAAEKWRQELSEAKMRSINPDNETEIDPGYLRHLPKNSSAATEADVEVIGDVTELQRAMAALPSEQDTDSAWSLSAGEAEDIDETSKDESGRLSGREDGEGARSRNGQQGPEKVVGGFSPSSQGPAATDGKEGGDIGRALWGAGAGIFGGDAGGESSDDSWPCSNCGEYNCEEKSAFWATAQPQPTFHPRCVLVRQKKKKGYGYTSKWLDAAEVEDDESEGMPSSADFIDNAPQPLSPTADHHRDDAGIECVLYREHSGL